MIALGQATIASVVEVNRSSFSTPEMLPESSQVAIDAHHDWLRPFLDPTTGDLASRIQTYVVRTPTTTVLVDTGVGNDKAREGAPAWNRRQGAWLEDLRAAGVTPEQVDVVVCTHLHVDHVGWNTRLVGGRWVPTFPRARYLFVGEEWDFWRHEKDACIADSVVPVVEAGQATLVAADHVIDPWLRFEPAPGHTPGHACVRLVTEVGEAVFAGDLMHRIVQVAEPAWSSRFCHDPARARATRRAFVERHADSGVLVVAAHFPTPGFIVREASGHRFVAAPRHPAARAS